MRELAALLIQPAQEGYPTDYLLARIPVRRKNLVTGRLSPPVPSVPQETSSCLGQGDTPRGRSPTLAREKMRQEFRWVYLRMNPRVRDSFAPLFLWFELRTILISLRLRRGGESEKIAELLTDTLLARRVQLLLGEPAAGADAVTGLLEEIGGPGRGLGALYREQKGREYEERCTALYLERVLRLPLHPVLREFFRLVIDLVNLLALAKLLRWRLEEPRPFIRGGTFAARRLEKVLENKSSGGLAALFPLRRGAGDLPALPDNPEHFLLCRLTRKVRKLDRDPLGVGCILAYLWDCSVEARNAGLVQHAAALGEQTMRAELIG